MEEQKLVVHGNEVTSEQMAEAKRLDATLTAFEKVKLFRAAIKEIQAKPESEKTLEDHKKIQDYMLAINAVIKKMPRGDRRKFKKKAHKKSTIIRKLLKQNELKN